MSVYVGTLNGTYKQETELRHIQAEQETDNAQVV